MSVGWLPRMALQVRTDPRNFTIAVGGIPKGRIRGLFLVDCAMLLACAGCATMSGTNDFVEIKSFLFMQGAA